MAGIFATEQVLAFLFHHVFEKHSAQFGNRALLITNPEEAMNVAKFMKLILGPPLKLFSGQSTTEEKLPNRMGSGVSPLQDILKISNQILWTEYLCHEHLRLKAAFLIMKSSYPTSWSMTSQELACQLSFGVAFTSIRPWFPLPCVSSRNGLVPSSPSIVPTSRSTAVTSWASLERAAVARRQP